MTKMIKKNWKQTLWKTINVISSVALVANMSMIGVFAAPQVANATVTPTYCPSGNPLYMWDRTPNISWSHGQISGYFEGEYIPVQLELDGLTAGVTRTIRVEHQYIRASVVGIERLDHVNAPAESGLTFNADRLDFSMSSATIIPGNPSLKQYTLTFTPASSTATLYFDALIGPTAHLYNGASLHVSLPDCGSKDVPIAVNQILYHGLSITKSDNPDPIQLNANTTYTITASNNGKTDGGEKNFTVTDTLPAGMAYVNGSASPAPTLVVGQVITWNFGTVADGTMKTITYQATGTAVGTHTNSASVTADGTTPVTTTEPTTVLGQCALVITKSVENYTHPNGPNEPGDLLKYTLNFQNTGSADCTGGGVRVDDTIPANTTYANWHDQSSNVAFGYTYSDFGGANPTGFNGTLLSWNAGTLTPGESGWAKFKVQINKVDACQNVDITNKGIIYADQIPSGVWSNEVTTNVTTPCTYCGDGIKQTPNDAGQNEECDGTDGTPDHYTCTNECTLEYVPYCGDGIVNQTSEQCDDGNSVDTDSCSNQCQTQTCNLVITKSVNKQNAVPGDTLTYTLEYQNNGSMICTGTGVKIYDPLDSRLTYVADSKAITINNDGEGDGYSPTEGSNYDGDVNLLLYNVRRVSPGESGTITFDVTVNDSFECGHTTVPNKGKIWSDQTGYIWSNEVNTDIYRECYGSLKVIKYVDTGDAAPDQWSFTVDGKTLTPASGENYVIFDNLYMGEYTATESDLAGYHQVSTTCNNVGVTAGQQATCEFYNARDTGDLTINKALDTDGDEQVDVTNPAGWTYDINSVSPDYDMGTTQTVLTGTYTVNERQHADFHSLGWTCTDGTSGTGEQLTVDVTTGNVACTFTNSRDTATVIVNKFVQLPAGDPIYNPADWSWSVDGSGSYPGGHVEILDTNVTYTVAEDTSIYSSDDFSTTWICWDGDSIYAQGSGTSFDVTPTYHRQSIVCTFTNTRDTTDITFDKVVVGGDHADNAWAFAVDGQGAYHDGDSVTLPTNETFTVTESSQYDALYTMTNAWGACELTTDGIVLHTDGRDTTCYVENTRDTGKLILVKNVINDNGGTADASNFTLHVKSNDTDVAGSPATGSKTGTEYTLVTGDYTVSEDTPLAGYTQISIVCDGQATDTVTVTSGETKTCTITNDDIPGQLDGYKYDQNEKGLAGWKICLDPGTNDERCTTTDEDGYFKFDNVSAGLHDVAETLQFGWTAIDPTSGAYSDVAVDLNKTTTVYFMNRMNEFGVSIEKSAPATVNAGDNITYALNWAVTGNTDVYNATVTDPLPANTTFVSADNGGTYDSNTNSVTWDLGTVTPDDSGTVTLVVKTATPLDNGTVIENIGTICGTGDIAGDTQEGTEKCDTSTTTTTTESAPVLGISKTNDKPVGEPGDRVNYTIAWSVDGNSKATNVTITDTIPAELVLDTATISHGGTYNAATRVVTWDLGTQVPYASGTVTYSGNFATPLADGTHVVNVTKITSTETDPTFWEAESISVINSGPVLVITKVVTPTETVAGAQVTYTVVIKNTGNDTAVNVKMTDLLPAGFTFDEFGGSSHTFTLGNLAAGAQTTVTYKVNIGASVTPGKYDNLAVASADNHPNVSAKATVTIGQVLGEEALPILSITKTADAEFINPGGHVTYHVTITNTGDAPDINVKLQDVMPAGFTFDVGGITKVWSLGDLAAGASIKVAYTAIADQTVLPGNYENIAVAWADNADKVTASAPVEVRQVQVLGAELPETGAGAMDYVYFFAAGMLLALSLFLLKLTFSKETEQ